MGLASTASFPASASFRGAASAAAAASASFFLSLSREILMSEYSSSPPSNLVSRCTRQVDDALSSLRRVTTGEALDSSSGRIPAEAEEVTEASSPSPTGIGFRLTLSTWNLLSWLWTRVDFLRVRPENSGASVEAAALPLLDLEDSIFLREAAPSFEWLPRLPVWSAGLPARDPRRDDDDGDPGVFLRTTPLNSGSSAAVVEPRLDKTLLLMDVRLVKDPLL